MVKNYFFQLSGKYKSKCIIKLILSKIYPQDSVVPKYDASNIRKEGSCPATTTPVTMAFRGPPQDSETRWTGEL